MNSILNKYSRIITEDISQPSSRAMLHGIGLTREDLKKPQAGIASLMCFAEGSSPELINSAESAYKTMQVVEAAYESSDGGGTKVDY